MFSLKGRRGDLVRKLCEHPFRGGQFNQLLFDAFSNNEFVTLFKMLELGKL